MADNDLQISFGADISGLASGTSAARAALQSVAPEVTALQAILSRLSLAVSTAFKGVDATPLTNAMGQAASGAQQFGLSLTAITSQMGTWSAGLAATAQGSAQSATAIGAMAGALSQMTGPLTQQAGGFAALTNGLQATSVQSSVVKTALDGATQGVSNLGSSAVSSQPALAALSGVLQTTASATPPLIEATTQLVDNWSGFVAQTAPIAQALSAVASAAGSVKEVFDSVNTTVQGVNATIGDVTQVLAGLNEVLTAAKALLGGASAGMVALDTAADANPIGAIVTVVAALVKGLIDLVAWLAKIGALGDAWHALEAGALVFWNDLKALLGVVGVVGVAIADLLTHHSFDNLRSGFAGVQRDIEESIDAANAFTGALGNVIDKAKQAKDAAAEVPNGAAGPAGASGSTNWAAASPGGAGSGAGAGDDNIGSGAAAGAEQVSEATAMIAQNYQTLLGQVTTVAGGITLAFQQSGAAQVLATDISVRDQLTTQTDGLRQIESQTKSLVSGFTTGLLQMAEGTKSFAQVMASLGQRILQDFITDVVDKKIDAWLFGEMAQTGATTGQSVIRQGIQGIESLFGVATSKTAAMADITASAAQAYAAAFAATAAIPVIGPELAPGAAAAAYAGAMGGAAMLAAAGGFDIPSGLNPITQLHQEEMVLPARLANPMRGMLADYAANRNSPSAANDSDAAATHHHHYQINALDGQSFRNFLRGRTDDMSTVLQEMGRRGQKTG